MGCWSSLGERCILGTFLENVAQYFTFGYLKCMLSQTIFFLSFASSRYGSLLLQLNLLLNIILCHYVYHFVAIFSYILNVVSLFNLSLFTFNKYFKLSSKGLVQSINNNIDFNWD